MRGAQLLGAVAGDPAERGIDRDDGVARSVTSTPSPVDSTMLRYCDSRSASADFTWRSWTSAASNSIGAASSVRNSWIGRVASSGDAPGTARGRRSRSRSPGTRKPSSAALTPPVPKRTAAHRNSGSGASSSGVIAVVPRRPNTAIATTASASASTAASAYLRRDAVFSQAARAARDHHRGHPDQVGQHVRPEPRVPDQPEVVRPSAPRHRGGVGERHDAAAPRPRRAGTRRRCGCRRTAARRARSGARRARPARRRPGCEGRAATSSRRHVVGTWTATCAGSTASA